MKYKHDSLKKEFKHAPMSLKSMAKDFNDISISLFNIEPVVTRILGEVKGDSGVHSDYRAIDFRDEFSDEFTYSTTQIEVLLNYMNSKYKRRDLYQVLIHHSFNGGKYHFHLQAPYKTTDLLLS